MRDNELILRLIGDTEGFVKSRLVAVIEADASPDTIREFVNCLSSLQCAVNNMGGQRFDAPIPSSSFGDSNAIYTIAREAVASCGESSLCGESSCNAIYTIAREAVAPIEKSLIQLTERIEKSLEGGDRHD